MAHPTYIFFFFNDTATTEIYTLSLHDALPILSLFAPRWWSPRFGWQRSVRWGKGSLPALGPRAQRTRRSEEHTSELQSRLHLVCRLLLEKKNTRAAILDPIDPMNAFDSSTHEV